MPYDYYDYLKKQRQNKNYTETSDLVRQNLWWETYHFRLSLMWIAIEDRLFNRLYLTLRYT